jgi:type II secretory pathway component GspD/PulD (secretin)
MLERWFLMAILIVAALPLTGASAAGGMVTEVIPAGFRPVDELVQIIRPLVPKPGSVSGAYGKLIIRTTPENMREIKEILATLNRAPANLLVSVRYSLDEEIKRDLVEAFGQVSGSNAGISTGNSAGSGRGLVISGQDGDQQIGVRLDKSQSIANDAATQRVRVLEGKEAFIQSGHSVPVNDERVIVSGNGVTTVQRSTGFRNVSSGFYVRARLTGDGHVNVEVFPQHNRLDADTGAIAVREASTVVSSPLGRWMEIGGVSGSTRENSRGIGSASSTASSSQSATYLKVEKLE